MKWFVLLMLFSGAVQAITVQQLVNKYGKEAVVKVITDKTRGRLTIIRDGDIEEKQRPSLKYATPQTIAIDFNKIGVTANQVDRLFTEKKQKERDIEIKRQAERVALEHERIIKQEARIKAELKLARERKKLAEEERLRPKDKFDLAVALAAQKGRRVQVKENQIQMQKRVAITKREKRKKLLASLYKSSMSRFKI